LQALNDEPNPPQFTSPMPELPDFKMCLAKASGNHKEFHLPVVFPFVFFVNFVVKHYPQVSGSEDRIGRTHGPSTVTNIVEE
jgi:hypothetical protein